MLTYHGNPETYHFANWVLHSGRLNVQELIDCAEAYAKAEGEKYEEWSLEYLPEDTQEQLAGLLQSAVEDDLSHDFCPDYCGVGSWPGIGDAYPDDPENSLFLGLLNRAIGRINFDVAAKIIIREHAGADALPSIN